MSRLSAWRRRRRLSLQWIGGSDQRPQVPLWLDMLRGRAPRLHVLGDSHTRVYSALPGAVVHTILGATMHRMARDNAWFLRKIRKRTPAASVLILVFGEIDVRVHVGPVAERTNQSVDAVIDDLAERYLSAVDAKRWGRRIVIVGVLPPAAKESIERPSVYPTWGSDAQRLKATTRLNRQLKLGSAKRGFKFVDVTGAFADERGYLRREMTDGNVHILPEFAEPVIAASRAAVA